ncbi:MAG: AAA family ATPase [Thermodesulfobacteriota bacterium]
MSDQTEVVRALSQPSFYPHRPDAVRHHQTHVSHVFIAGEYAYKLKKSVRYSFADFSTLDLRRRFCDEEVRLNRRLCAPVYLGVRRVTREPDGSLALDGTGAEVEPLVWMRALPERGMLPVALAEGRVAPATLERFARTLAEFHASPDSAAPAGLEVADAAATSARWRQVMDDAAPMAGTLLDVADHEVLADFGPTFAHRHESLLAARGPAGRVRDGHGDLHAGNLCLVDTALPALDEAPEVPAGLHAFDCLEFSPELRTNDVASEVAFLAMDLEARGHPALAQAFVAAYVAATGDADVSVLLPFYACHRACIRGMVLGLKARASDVDPRERDEAAARARVHFALATRLAWGAAGPAIVCCTGLSGSGKTTLAVALARTTGFRHVSSDEVRKRRAGLDPHARAAADVGAALYRDEMRRATYRALAGEAEETLGHGRAVILDATFHRREEREPVRTLARRLRCPLVFLECVADEATIRERLRRRSERPAEAAAGQPALSDAGWEVYVAQRGRAEPLHDDEPALRVDTGGDVAAVRTRALRALWAWRRQHAARAVLTDAR